MSIRRMEDFQHRAKSFIGYGASLKYRNGFEDKYRRNPMWKVLPNINNTNAVSILCAVFEGSENIVTFTVGTKSGTTTVDWGDGTTETFSTSPSSKVFTKTYNFSSLDAIKTCSISASTGRVTVVDNPFVDGDKINFFKLSSASAGLYEAVTYIVRDVSGNSFCVSEYFDSPAISFTVDVTAELLMYKQALIKVTATDEINVFTANPIEPSFTQQTHCATSYLDIEASLSTSVNTTGNLNQTGGGPLRNNCNLEHYGLIRDRCVDYNYAFGTSYRLKSVAGSKLSSSVATGFNFAFTTCVSLFDIPEISSTTITSLFSPFLNCYSLKAIGSFNIKGSAALSYFSTFENCYSLIRVPVISTTTTVTSASYSSSFKNCLGLIDGTLQYSNVTSMPMAFYGCKSLRIAPKISDGTCADFSSAFYGCSSLKTAPVYKPHTSTASNLGFMFRQCTSLSTSSIDLEASYVSSVGGIFQDCFNLLELPKIRLLSTGSSGVTVDCAAMLTNNYALSGQVYVYLNSSIAVTLTGIVDQTRVSKFIAERAARTDTSTVYSSFSSTAGARSLKSIVFINFGGSLDVSAMATCNFRSTPVLGRIQGASFGNASSLSSSLGDTTNDLPALRILTIAGDASVHGIGAATSFGYYQMDKTSRQGLIDLIKFKAATFTINTGSSFNDQFTFDQNRNWNFTNGSSVVTLNTNNTTGFSAGMFFCNGPASASNPTRSVTLGTDSTVTFSSHGFTAGQVVAFSIVTGPTAQVLTGTKYFVVNPTTNTFQISLTEGGSPVSFTTAGTGSLNYVVKIVSIDSTTSMTISVPYIGTSKQASCVVTDLDVTNLIVKNVTLSSV